MTVRKSLAGLSRMRALEHTHTSKDQAAGTGSLDPFQMAVTFPHKGIELGQ